MNKIELGHIKRIKTRKKRGWWRSPNAIENMRQAQLHLSKEIKRKRVEALRDSDWIKFVGFRNLFRKFKLKYPNIIFRICPVCKKGYIIPKSESWRKTCSQKCGLTLSAGFNRSKKRPDFCGKNNPNYVTGQSKERYKKIRINGKDKYIHIVNCLRKEGFYRLPPNCCVHHLDGNKFNNHTNNLQLLDIDFHNKFHSILMSK